MSAEDPKKVFGLILMVSGLFYFIFTWVLLIDGYISYVLNSSYETFQESFDVFVCVWCVYVCVCAVCVSVSVCGVCVVYVSVCLCVCGVYMYVCVPCVCL